jgi:hypothetical protein
MAISSSDIEDRAKSPAKVRTDEGTVEEKDVGEIIRADRYNKASTAAVAKVPWGLRMARGKPGGAVV